MIVNLTLDGDFGVEFEKYTYTSSYIVSNDNKQVEDARRELGI